MKTRITGGTLSLMNGTFFGTLEIYREADGNDLSVFFELELGVQEAQKVPSLLSTAYTATETQSASRPSIT